MRIRNVQEMFRLRFALLNITERTILYRPSRYCLFTLFRFSLNRIAKLHVTF